MGRGTAKTVACRIARDELASVSNDSYRQSPNNVLSLADRIHFFPQFNLLAVINEGRNELVLRKINILKHLDETGIDYLFVSSHAQTVVGRGAAYNYTIAVKSKNGDVRYKLESGPDGMEVAENGELTWNVPDSHQTGPVGVIVSITDASAQEIYHSFNLTIR